MFCPDKKHVYVSFDKHFSTSIANNYFLRYDISVVSLPLVTLAQVTLD